MSNSVLAKLTFTEEEAQEIIDWSFDQIAYDQYLDYEEDGQNRIYEYVSSVNPRIQASIIETWEEDDRVDIEVWFDAKNVSYLDILAAFVGDGILTIDKAERILKG